MGRRTGAGIGWAALLASALVASSSCGGTAPTKPALAAFELPNGDSPEQLAVADDGAVWLTVEFGGARRLDPATGRFTNYVIEDEDGDLGTASPEDLVPGLDGAVYVAAGDVVSRIDEDGRVENWPTDSGGPTPAIVTGGGDVWFVNGYDKLDRLGRDGTMTGFEVPGEGDFWIPDLAFGPDKALWFTVDGFGRSSADRIGRMTTDGQFTTWRLPHRHAAPTSIAAGPDGALWFTEPGVPALGRITTTGTVTEFPLPGGLHPYDLTAGPGGAVWFTADGCVGRITAAGELTSWPVRGARQLVGIAAAPDGSLWLADRVAHTLFRLRPGADPAPHQAPCRPPAITRSAGRTRATLVYQRLDTLGREDFFGDARVRITRNGRRLFAESVPPSPEEPGSAVYGYENGFSVLDLDGDDEPEVVLELGTEHPHCCSWTRVYRYDAARRTYVPGNHMWGNGSAAPTIRDVNADGRPELVSQDDRFAYDFAGYAGSARPIQIWSYGRGVFRDTTRRFPREIRRDAAALWKLNLRYRTGGDMRGILPAWAADQYLLGRGATVWPALERARRGDYLGTGCEFDPCGKAYIRAVRALLERLGYIR